MHVSVTYYAGIASRVQKVFFAILLEIKIGYLLGTKVSNRLLLVLGVISPRAKSPFIFFFEIFVFYSSRADILFFCSFFLMQKCECVVPGQMFQ